MAVPAESCFCSEPPAACCRHLFAHQQKANGEQQETGRGQKKGMEAEKTRGCFSHLSLWSLKTSQVAATNAKLWFFQSQQCLRRLQTHLRHRRALIQVSTACKARLQTGTATCLSIVSHLIDSKTSNPDPYTSPFLHSLLFSSATLLLKWKSNQIR